jgi:hypothetical protein
VELLIPSAISFCFSILAITVILAILASSLDLTFALLSALCGISSLFDQRLSAEICGKMGFAIAPSTQSPPPDNPANCAPSTESNRTLSDREDAAENSGS